MDLARRRAPISGLHAVLVALLLAACATPAPTPAPGTGLAALPVATIRLNDGRVLRVVVAQDLGLGLAGVTELGGFDGMLFDYGREVLPAAHPFWMAGVHLALDLGFFDAAGRLVDRERMDPCPERRNCPTHVAVAPFRWVLEVPAGTLAPATALAVVALEP